MKHRKLFAAFLFILGLCIFLYPTFSRLYYDRQVREEVEDLFEDLDAEFYEEQLRYNQQAITDPNNIEVANVEYVDNDDDSNQSSVQMLNQEMGVLGSLHIPKINLVYQIYDGATNENLLKGVARIEGTSYPVGGINTNSVIAGHSSMARRNYFTHIKDLVNGDIIQIRNPQQVLTYEVYATAVIEPNDTAALAVIPGQDTITLLTCTWPPPGTHRYLVYARRIADRPLESVVSNQ